MMTRPLSRVRPVGPPQAYKTYQVAVPRSSYRKATCEEFGCLKYARGFKVAVPAGPSREAYLIKTSGKPYTVEEGEDGGKFAVFPPGTACFAEPTHRVPDGPELYVVTGGDWRGNPTGMRRQHSRPQDWVEDFALHQNRIITDLNRG